MFSVLQGAWPLAHAWGLLLLGLLALLRGWARWDRGLLGLGWRLARLLAVLRWSLAVFWWGETVLYWGAALPRRGTVLLRWGTAILWCGAAILWWGAAWLGWRAAILW